MRRPNPLAAGINAKLSTDITHLLSIQQPKLLDRARRAEPARAVTRRMPLIVGLAGIAALILLAVTGGDLWLVTLVGLGFALALYLRAWVVARSGDLAIAEIRTFIEEQYNATLVRVTETGALVIEADRLLRSTPASDLRVA